MRITSEEEFKTWHKESKIPNEWEYTLTCKTPLKKLDQFVEEIINYIGNFEISVLCVTQIVFDPKSLIEFRKNQGEIQPVIKKPVHFVNSKDELKPLLKASLENWIDFSLYFFPSKLVITADHDEYTKFFSSSENELLFLKERLLKDGVKIVNFE